MALSKPGALWITAASLVLAGAAAWYFGTASVPEPGSGSSTPHPPAPSATPASLIPDEGKSPPLPQEGTGFITGRLVCGAATNPVQGEVTVALAGSAPASVRPAGRG